MCTYTQRAAYSPDAHGDVCKRAFIVFIIYSLAFAGNEISVITSQTIISPNFPGMKRVANRSELVRN